MPNPSNPLFWIGLVLVLGYFAADHLDKVRALFRWVWSSLPSFSSSESVVSVESKVPTAVEAFQALTVLTSFKRECSKDPSYGAVMAAFKSEVPE